MNQAVPTEAESVPVLMDTSVTPKVPVAPEITDTDKPASVTPPATRIVELVVPYDTPKQVVDLTVNLGMMAHEAITKGMMLILFPTISKDDKGVNHHAIGRCMMPISSAKDVQRVVSLAEAISQVNLAVLRDSQNPVNALPARLQGEKAKDDATRDLVAKTQGRAGGIITATR